METRQKKIVLAGGTGLVGRYLAVKYSDLGYRVLIISREATSADRISWNDVNGIREALENSEMLVNLAGKSVNCRYHQKNKEEILQSRLQSTALLGEILAQCTHPPPLWINAGTATIYRHAEDRPMTEEQGETGNDFSMHVAKEWERVFFSHPVENVRQAVLRMAIVMGKEAEVVRIYRRLVKYGLGGKQGNGRQMVSWVHIEDVFRAVEWVRNHPEIAGVLNISAPGPVTNTVLMRHFRRLAGKSWGIPAPRVVLKAGAFLIGTEAELVLKSRWVLPERLINDGFEFRFPTLEEALADITGKE